MKTHSLFLALFLLILTTAHAFGQSRFGEETRLTDIIVKIQPGTLELPESRHEVLLHEAEINVPEITLDSRTNMLYTVSGRCNNSFCLIPPHRVLLLNVNHRV